MLCTGSTADVFLFLSPSPGRHLFCLLRGLRVLFALKRSAQVAYKPNWRFRYENILGSIMRAGRYAKIQRATTRLGWWVFMADVVYARDAKEGSHLRWCDTFLRAFWNFFTDRNIYQYSDTQLYNQLLYFMSLFDGDKALSTIQDSESQSMYTIRISRRISSNLCGFISFLEHFSDVITKNTVLLQNLRECVEKHLTNCGRRWVDLTTIFSMIKV
jgi:hypothetical protein